MKDQDRFMECELSGYIAEVELDTGAEWPVLLTLSWKGKNPGVTAGMTLDELAGLRRMLRTAEARMQRMVARQVLGMEATK